jgi:hypothetical protein
MEPADGVEEYWIGAMRCQGCFEYILGIVLWHPYNGVQYETHYPLGKPDDDVAKEIPEHIQPDFQEALRCLFVDAYNATAEMCRRAIEASCLDLGAPKKDVLEDMIDWLADKRRTRFDLAGIGAHTRLWMEQRSRRYPNPRVLRLRKSKRITHWRLWILRDISLNTYM